MSQRFFVAVALLTTAACAHKRTPEVAPPVAYQRAPSKAECSRAAIDSLSSPTRRDSARIACDPYRYQTIKIF
jgi:hypothetical protein